MQRLSVWRSAHAAYAIPRSSWIRFRRKEGAGHVSFTDAISTCFSKYGKFSGRARRSEYWYWTLFSVLIGFIAGAVEEVAGTSFIAPIVVFGLLLPSLAVGARRLHDVGRSGWFLLLLVAPLGPFFLLYWFVKDSGHGANKQRCEPEAGGRRYGRRAAWLGPMRTPPLIVGSGTYP